jgi:hypothetical protein
MEFAGLAAVALSFVGWAVVVSGLVGVVVVVSTVVVLHRVDLATVSVVGRLAVGCRQGQIADQD